MKEVLLSRRAAVKSTLLGMVAVSLPNLVRAGGGAAPRLLEEAEIFHRYPSIDDAIVSTVVGKSHFDLEAVQQLVEPRPELARATWDWSFGDWESALGAASHVGRRDIANYLIGKGARPTIFTYAMFGKHAAVKAMVQGMPGVQRTAGPHGIDLLTHARIGAGAKGLSTQEQEDCERTVTYLEGLGDAAIAVTDVAMSKEEQEKFLGDYMYGPGPSDGLSVKRNMRDMLAMGKLGAFGGGLYHLGDHVFQYNGVPSVRISFEVSAGVVRSLTIQEPELTVVARKV